LYEEFAKTFGDIIDLKKAQLYDELGLDPNGVPYDTRAHMHKLQELLKKEAIGRDYPIQDVKSLDLVELTDAQNKNKYYEFTMPLWLSANSNRFESMLNSIITKRVLAHKFPGNSFVAGSEHGYKFKEDLAGIDTSRIIYFDNYNGEELGAVSTEDVDGKPVFTKAQVLVPSKFKKSDGTLINLFEKVDGQYKYLIEEKGKPLKLKPNMIDPKLFSMFSFRTPTSSHVSGSIIEIAGILPPESGDLMIVPKNFTKQKGLDFDVDKENTYQLNHHVTKEGRIEEFTDYHVEKVRKQIDKLVNSKEYQDALALEKVERTVPEKMLKDFYDGLEDMFTEEELEEVKASRESLAEKTQSLKRKLKEKELKVLENKFIKIHQAVFSNPSDEMQKKVNKVLSMDFAREQAELIESMTDSSQGTPWDFTILSDQYQKEKMGLGAAGKMAIGVYSNYVTFHGLVQQLDTPSYLQRKNPEDPQGPSEKFEITIGKIYSNGMLGGQRTLTEHRDVPGDRSIAEVYAEKQNTATDNEKEQILGRVNINSLTIGVDSLLAGLGFDKVKYDTGEKDEYGKPIFKDISISYALLSQPVIREFVEHMQSGMGIISDFTSNLEETTIENLRKKYSETGKEEITSELLTGEALIAGLQTNGTQKDVQLAALNLFLELRAAAKKMSKVQSLINTKDLGKSATEAFGKYDNLENLAKTDVMSNATKLVGIYIPVAEGKPGKDYIQTKNYYILPTTPQGKMIATGITLGYDLWSDFFPYEDPHFKNIVDTIIKESTVDIDKTEKLIEAKHEIYREIKKYIYSSNYFGIFTENPEVERQRLFFDVVKGENQQQSLASYMSENQRHENLAQNKLLARFTYDLQTNGMPSTVRYNNTTSDDLEEKYLYTAFAEMILDEKELPPLNGKPMTTKMLAQELISYAYLEGGVQEAIQFIKYVPLEYLKEVGRYEEAEGRFVTALEKFQRLNPNRSGKVFETMLGEHSTSDKDRGIVTNPFITQFFQHNPDKVKKYQTKDKNLDLSKRDEGKATLVAEKLPAFFTINSKGKSKNKKDKVDLYKHIGGGAYVLIPTLGVHGMNEYQSENKNATSLVTKTKKTAPAIPVVTQVGPVVEAPTAADFMITNRPATDILNDISKSEIPAIAQYKALAGALLPIISQTGTQVKVVESTTPIMGGEVQGIYDTTNNNDTIYINSTASTNMVVTFMHEAMHSLTTKELEKYYDYDENGFATKFKTGITIPQHVVELHMVWQEAIRQSDPVKVQVVRDKVIRMRNGENVGLIEDKEAGIHEETLLYPLLDIFEFTQAALQSREFQQHYNQVPYKKSGKTIIDKIMDSFYKLLEALSIEKDTLSHASFVAAMRFVEEEHKGRRAVEDDATAGMPKLPSTIKFEDQLAHEKIFNAVGNALGGTAPLGSNLSTNLEEGKARGETMPPMSPRIESKEDYDTFVNEKETKLPCEGGLPI
jgi:hypothetical protein